MEIIRTNNDHSIFEVNDILYSLNSHWNPNCIFCFHMCPWRIPVSILEMSILAQTTICRVFRSYNFMNSIFLLIKGESAIEWSLNTQTYIVLKYYEVSPDNRTGCLLWLFFFPSFTCFSYIHYQMEDRRHQQQWHN